MVILKCPKFLVLIGVLSVIGCNSEEYIVTDYAFDSFILENWKFSTKPDHIALEKIDKDGKLIKNEKLITFETTIDTVRNVVFIVPTPNLKGKVNFDMKLILNDSMVFNIKNIKSSRDTLVRRFSMSKKVYVYNSIDTVMVNGRQQKGGTADIYLSLDVAKIIKKTK